MRSYIGRRIGLAVLNLFGATLITFLLTQTIPSDPAMLWVGRFATQQQIERAREELGLHHPWYVRYFRYLGKILHGDFGISLRTHKPVAQELAHRLPASFELVFVGMVLGLTVGVALGMFSAVKQNSLFDQLARLISVGGVALPSFWFAMILQLIFAKELSILPIGGRLDSVIEFFHPCRRITGFVLLDAAISGNWVVFKNGLAHLILPAMTLAAYPIGMSARLIRAKMLEVLSEDYIRTARAFGIRDLKIFTHWALRNAVGPVVTLSAISFVYTLVGAFLVEVIFAWPGIGSYTAQAILCNDVPALLGVTLLVASLTVVFNLTADMALAWLDPRIRFQ